MCKRLFHLCGTGNELDVGVTESEMHIKSGRENEGSNVALAVILMGKVLLTES